MENEIQLNIPPVQSLPQARVSIPTPPSLNWSKILLFTVLGLVIVAVSVFIGIQIGKTQTPNQQPNTVLPSASPTQVEVSPTIQPTTSPTTNPIINWKTYTNKILKYTIDYPSDWSINILEAELPISTENSQKLVIYKGQYRLTIVWPSAYGPGICLFDDESRVGAPEIASYCEGKYIEFTSNSGKNTHRRLVKPEAFNDYQQWQVYTKEKTYFVTVPPTMFFAPLDHKVDQIYLMDQILATYKSIN